MSPEPLLILDVPWLLYRSYFALPSSIRDPEGRPVNALLGTVNAVLGLIAPPPDSPHKPLRVRAVAACTGAEQAAYRVALYPPYHAHRDPMPAALAEQWAKAPALLESLGWAVLDGGQLEADDVMFSLAETEQQAGGSALLMTADRDLHAVASNSASVVALERGGGHSLIGPGEVREQHGVEPSQIADLIALRGDPSDGIPGAAGIGAKTAAALLQAHGTLEGVLSAAGEGVLKPRVAEALLADADKLRDFKEIATLQHVEVARPPDRALQAGAGADCAERLGMRRLAARLRELAASQPSAPSTARA